jgi:predicted patatin/cPLA2 family phospholipase
MRGVVSAGMVCALEALGLTEAFDAVYGSSAGAINAAYFLAGQARLGTSIYYEDINNRRFIDLKRALRGRAILDLSFLLDDVAIRRKPLDVGKVLCSPSRLTVMATDVELETAVTMGGFERAEDLLGALRASATMPVVAGPPHTYRGRRYLDASLTEPIAVPTAEAAGHDIIVALLTRDGEMRSRPSAFDRYFVAPQLRRVSGALADRYLTRAIPHANLLRLIRAGTGPLGHARVLAVTVEGLQLSKLECRPDVLKAGAQRGYAAVMRLFERAPPGESPFA